MLICSISISISISKSNRAETGMKRFTLITGLILTFCALGYAGSMDAEDELNRQAQYCKMVEAGDWPDYDKMINCEESK